MRCCQPRPSFVICGRAVRVILWKSSEGKSKMSQTGGASTSSAGKKKPAAKKTPTHPPYITMIQQGLTDLQGKGSSRQALLKYMMKKYDLGTDEKSVNSHLKLALKNGLDNGVLVQSKGTGAAGSVRLSKKATTPVSTKAKPKKPKTAAAAKKPRATKAAITKKTTTPRKVSLSGSAAKAKKPSLTKKSTAKLVSKTKTAAKKAPAKPKVTKAKVVKPKATKAAAGKAKKPAARK